MRHFTMKGWRDATVVDKRGRPPGRGSNSRAVQRAAGIMRAMSCLSPRLFAALAAVALGAFIPPVAAVARDSDAALRARVVELVNDARRKSRRCGSEKFAAAPPLSASRQLSDAAAAHARDMARKKYFDHRGPDGSQPRDRVKRAGYQSKLTGENIALGPETAEEVVAGWLESPGHCANIMEPRFRNIGVGIATGRGRGQIYWVQTFGSPR